LLNLAFQLFHRGIRSRSRHCLIGRRFFEIEGEDAECGGRKINSNQLVFTQQF
jgi:hypothetical protein